MRVGGWGIIQTETLNLGPIPLGLIDRPVIWFWIIPNNVYNRFTDDPCVRGDGAKLYFFSVSIIIYGFHNLGKEYTEKMRAKKVKMTMKDEERDRCVAMECSAMIGSLDGCQDAEIHVKRKIHHVKAYHIMYVERMWF